MNITIKLGSKPITTDKLRAIGFAAIDLATSVERHKLQLAQARENPGSEKEREEADRAFSRALKSERKLRKLIAEATA